MLQAYVGIADAHGIESFLLEDKANSFILHLRASANRQRHALVYRVLLTPDQAEHVQAQLEVKDFIGALKLLKAIAPGIEVEKSFSRSWKMIPNPELDPYWSPEG